MLANRSEFDWAEGSASSRGELDGTHPPLDPSSSTMSGEYQASTRSHWCIKLTHVCSLQLPAKSLVRNGDVTRIWTSVVGFVLPPSG